MPPEGGPPFSYSIQSQAAADQLRAEAQSFARCSATADFAEGVTAFIEKRKPSFNGD